MRKIEGTENKNVVDLGVYLKLLHVTDITVSVPI